MSRILTISSDCHAGLRPGEYREFVDPQHRQAYDDQVAEQVAQFEAAAKSFMVDEFAEEWERGKEEGLTGAWDSERRNAALDADSVVGEVVFPDGLTGGNSPPLGAGLGLRTDCDPKLQLAGARAHNRWVTDFCSLAPERRAGLALVPILHDIDAAVAEIEWAAKAGLRGSLELRHLFRDLIVIRLPVFRVQVLAVLSGLKPRVAIRRDCENATHLSFLLFEIAPVPIVRPDSSRTVAPTCGTRSVGCPLCRRPGWRCGSCSSRRPSRPSPRS